MISKLARNKVKWQWQFRENTETQFCPDVRTKSNPSFWSSKQNWIFNAAAQLLVHRSKLILAFPKISFGILTTFEQGIIQGGKQERAKGANGTLTGSTVGSSARWIAPGSPPESTASRARSMTGAGGHITISSAPAAFQPSRSTLREEPSRQGRAFGAAGPSGERKRRRVASAARGPARRPAGTGRWPRGSGRRSRRRRRRRREPASAAGEDAGTAGLACSLPLACYWNDHYKCVSVIKLMMCWFDLDDELREGFVIWSPYILCRAGVLDQLAIHENAKIIWASGVHAAHDACSGFKNSTDLSNFLNLRPEMETNAPGCQRLNITPCGPWNGTQTLLCWSCSHVMIP
jgi:hypothetical protein